MTYTINGTQYWRRNGIYCSWTEEGGRKVITREEYEAALSIKPSTNNLNKVSIKPKEINPLDGLTDKDKVQIVYQEIGKSGNPNTKKKVITFGNLDKVVSNMKKKDNFIKILDTKVAQ